MKKFTLIALALLLTLGLAFPVLGSINREHIVEDIDVLDETDASTIEDLGEEIKEAYGIHPIFFLMKHYEMDDYYGFIDQKLAELDVEDRFLFILIDAEHNEYSYAVAEELEDYIDEDFLHEIFRVYDRADTYNGGIIDAFEALNAELDTVLDGKTAEDIIGEAADEPELEGDFRDLEYTRAHWDFELYDDDALQVFLRLEARAKEIGEALDVPIYIHSGYDLVDEIAEYDDFNAYVKESHFFDSGHSFDDKGIYILITDVGRIGWYATDNVLAALDETTIRGLDELVEEATLEDERMPVKDWGAIADRILDVLEEAEIDSEILDGYVEEPEEEEWPYERLISPGDEIPSDETEFETLDELLIEMSEANDAEFFIALDLSGYVGTDEEDVDAFLDILMALGFEGQNGVGLFWGQDDFKKIKLYGEGKGLEGQALDVLENFLAGRSLDFTALYGYASMVKEMYPLYAGGASPDADIDEPEPEPEPEDEPEEETPATISEEDFVYPRGDTLRDQPYMVDEAGLLTDDEVAKLNEKLDALADEYWVDLAIVTVESLNGKHPMKRAMEYYNAHGYGQGPDDDGILFLLCPEDRDYAIVTHNYGRYAVPDGEGRDRLLRDVLKALSKDKYYKAFDTLADEAAVFFERARNGDAYDGGTLQPQKNRAVGTPLLGILSGLGGGFGIVSVEKNKLKNVKAKVTASNYALMETRQLYRQSDNLVDTSTRVVRRSESSSSRSGGGGGSGHRSGGRSFGGGSGKY